jgi:hypothetical protein
MKHVLRSFVVGVVTAALAAPALAGKPVEIRLKDGTRWRGELSDRVRLTLLDQGNRVALEGRLVEVGQWHVTIEAELAGEVRRRTIFTGDLLAVGSAGQPSDAGEAAPDLSPKKGSSKRPGSVAADRDQPGVFVLPLKNTVGVYVRHEEMEKMAEHADQFGPGQIIVLLIDSPGGAVTEMEKIHDTLMAIKKRHRLVAWIKEAISAACATALHCDEIYFMTEGTAGAMTAFNAATGQAWKDEELKEWLKRAGEWAAAGGRSPYIAEAMIHAPRLLSYDKDPETGKVTFYNDLSGEFALSRQGENLVFTASQAVHCGFADGIADTEAELATVLDLPGWHEKDDFGRKMAEEWFQTVEEAQREIPKLSARLSFAGQGSGDSAVVIQKKIQILEELVRWHDRCPNVARGMIPPKEDLEREIKQLRRELANLRRRY